MTATLQVKKDRPNYYVVLDYKDSNAARKRKWISTDIPVAGNNKRKAEQKRKEVLAEYETLSDVVDLSKDILFVDFMKEWLENLKHSIAPTTYDGYNLTLNTHIVPYFQPKRLKLRGLTALHLQQYINVKMDRLSPNSIIKHLRNISKCLDGAVRQNLIAFNPVKRIDMPKKRRYTGAKHYSEKEIDMLLACSKGSIFMVV